MVGASAARPEEEAPSTGEALTAFGTASLDWTRPQAGLSFALMSKPSKAPEAAKAATPDLPFEAAIDKLEAIVESLESEDLPLEVLLSKFEEGTKLAQLCQAKLAEAELKIQRLEKKLSGELTLTPWSAAEDAATE
jgi:exodeoxyribonuclease VII small subunit